MLNETHLRLLRNASIFENKEAAVASFASSAATEIQNADGTPRLARYYANSAQTVVKTVLGIFHADTKSYTLFDADSESSAQMQREIDAIEQNLGLDEEGNYIPYSGGTHTSGATSMQDAIEKLDDALTDEEEKSDEISAKTDALLIDKVDRTELVWTKDAENNTSVARNTKNQKVAEIKDNKELWLYVEGEYMCVNDLLGQLAHETYDAVDEEVEGVTNVSDPQSAEELTVTAGTLNVSGSLNDAVANNRLAVSAEEINMNMVEANNVHADVTAPGNVTITDMAIEGNLPKSVSNAGMSIATDGDVLIDGGSWGQDGYNAIEVGLGAGKTPKNVTVQNLDVNSTLTNNAVLVFATQDDATITIKDCHFASVSNVLRVSNRTNATGVTINIENVTVDHWDSDPDWAGLIIFEDYVNRADTVATENVFAPEKITVNIKNLVHDGKKVTIPAGGLKEIAGSRDENQVLYVWNNYEAPDGFVPYEGNENRYPVINIE